jgi:hypothetical protein
VQDFLYCVSKIVSLESREKEIKMEVEAIEEERATEHVKSEMRAAEEQQRDIESGLISTFTIAVESEKGLWKYKTILVPSDMIFEGENQEKRLKPVLVSDLERKYKDLGLIIKGLDDLCRRYQSLNMVVASLKAEYNQGIYCLSTLKTFQRAQFMKQLSNLRTS